MTKDAYYFSHDSNAHTDPKIIKLLHAHSWHGYGIYWALIELLRNESDYKLETDYDTHAFALRTDSDSIKRIVEDYKLFVIEENFFWSASLLRRMEKREAVNKKRSDSAKLRWDNTRAMQMHSECSPLKERKVKERKVVRTSDEHIKLAHRLRDIVLLRKDKTITDTTISKWANSIRLLIERDGRNIDELSKALDWYEAHWNDKFVPVIESADSLREKYDKLLNAMDRDPKSKSMKVDCSVCVYNQTRPCKHILNPEYVCETCTAFTRVDV